MTVGGQLIDVPSIDFKGGSGRNKGGDDAWNSFQAKKLCAKEQR